jgi:hypothetical protein
VSTEQENNKFPTPFETQLIGPNTRWFDIIGIRFFINTTDHPIKLGFSHNIRAVEMIAIGEPSDEDLKGDKVAALKGEIIEEDV